MTTKWRVEMFKKKKKDSSMRPKTMKRCIRTTHVLIISQYNQSANLPWLNPKKIKTCYYSTKVCIEKPNPIRQFKYFLTFFYFILRPYEYIANVEKCIMETKKESAGVLQSVGSYAKVSQVKKKKVIKLFF